MKILVTGSAGFIGSHTAVELFEAGHIPVVMDDFSNSQKFIIDNIEKIIGKKPVLYIGDCKDREFLKKVFQKEKDISGIIHFAGFKAVGESVQEPLRYYENNIFSLIALLDLMQEFKIKNLVFSSSATVYGNPDFCPISETALRKKSTSPYGNTKSICEDIIEDAVKGYENISAVSLRYFNPIGAHPSGLIGELPLGVPNNLVPFITQAAAGIREKLIVFGDDYNTMDGSGVRDFIHVVDLAKAHIKTLEFLEKQKTPYYDIFNVGTGNGNSVLEIIKTFEKINGVKVPFEIGPRREGDIAACYADTKKIENKLKWKAEKTLEDSLRDAWNWQIRL